MTLPSGAALQSGLRKQTLAPPNPLGMLMRGVVVATYVTDDPRNPYNTAKTTPYAVYCDVLCYGPAAGGSPTLITKAIVSQERAGIQSGDVWRPRAATLDVSGQPLHLATSNLMDLDGDHVLLGFLDGTYQNPVILRALPHPQGDVGQSQAEPSGGQALRLKLVDGSPDLRKHHGSVLGISDAGDIVMRTLYANKGELAADGAPPGPPSSADVGNLLMQLHKRAQRVTTLMDMDTPASATAVLQEIVSMTLWSLEFASSAAHWAVKDAGGNSLELRKSGAEATLVLGDGTHSAAVAEYLLGLYTQLKAQFDSHFHPSALGPTGTAQSAGFMAPGWDPKIASTHLKVPGEG